MLPVTPKSMNNKCLHVTNSWCAKKWEGKISNFKPWNKLKPQCSDLSHQSSQDQTRDFVFLSITFQVNKTPDLKYDGYLKFWHIQAFYCNSDLPKSLITAQISSIFFLWGFFSLKHVVSISVVHCIEIKHLLGVNYKVHEHQFFFLGGWN